MRMLCFAGAVRLYPRRHFGGLSVRRHHHPRQPAALRLLRHEPPGPADQLQPHQRGVQGEEAFFYSQMSVYHGHGIKQ